MNQVKVLLVEDDVEVAEVVCEFLTGLGMSVTVFHKPNMAWDEFSENPIFDLVLLDHFMPVMSGYEFAEKMRLGGYNNPVILTSGNHIYEKCKVLTDLVFLDKPYHLSSLEGQIKKLLEAQRQVPAIRSASQELTEFV